MNQLSNNRISIPIYLLALTYAQLIIVLPKLPLLQVAPINIFIVFLGFITIFRLRKLIQLNASVLVMLSTIAVFCILDVSISANLESSDNQIGHYLRGLTILTSTAVMVTKEKEVRILLNWVLFSLFVSAAVGLLIHFYGGFFLDFRNWLLQDSSSQSGIAGEGVWVSGLSGNHFGFGYLLAAAPILLVASAVGTQKKVVWWIVLAVFVLASILNAERSAVIAMIGGMTYLTIKIGVKNGKRFIAIFGFGILAAFLMESYRHEAAEKNDSQAATAMERFSQSGDAVDRLKWQYFGIKSVLMNPFTGVTEQEYRRVASGSVIMTGREFIPYPHNHYINVGMHIGAFGWILLTVFFVCLVKLIKIAHTRAFENGPGKMLLMGIHVALVATMSNALFHNNGIFFFEPMSTILLALTICLANLNSVTSVHKRSHVSI